MGINNGFGNTAGFMQSPFQQQMPYNNSPYQSSINNRTQNSRINWIQSVEDAKAYPLVPNSNVALIDGNKNILYLKSCDNMGMCVLRSFAITEIEEAAHQPEPDMSAYVRREEFDELKQLINIVNRTEEELASLNELAAKWTARISDKENKIIWAYEGYLDRLIAAEQWLENIGITNSS